MYGFTAKSSVTPSTTMSLINKIRWTNEFKSFLKLPILPNTLRQAACKSLGGGQSAMMHFISMIDPEYH